MFRWYRLYYAMNIVKTEMKDRGTPPFAEFSSCVNEYDEIGLELLKAGHGKYFSAAHQVTVIAIAYSKLADQLVLKDPWNEMVSDLFAAAKVAFELVVHRERDAMHSFSREVKDAEQMLIEWKAKCEPDGHRLWETFQTKLAPVIEADKRATEPFR